MAQQFELIPGPTDVDLSQVGHVIIPGRGRSDDGEALSVHSEQRVRVAAQLAAALDLHGVIVCAGDRTPSSTSGGRAEAVLMQQRLAELGYSGQVAVEDNSRTTLEALVNIELGTGAASGKYLPDQQPVAIVAQREHLVSTMRLAAHVLGRPLIGIVVPDEDYPDHYSFVATTMNDIAVLGLRPASSEANKRLRANLVTGANIFASWLGRIIEWRYYHNPES